MLKVIPAAEPRGGTLLSEDVKLCAVCGSPVSAADAVLYDYRLYCPACFARRSRDAAQPPEVEPRGRRRAERRRDGPPIEAEGSS